MVVAGESDVRERSDNCPEANQALTVRASNNAGDTATTLARTERRNRDGISPQMVRDGGVAVGTG